MKTYTLYKLQSSESSAIRYVGITSMTLKSRLANHKGTPRHINPHKWNWIKKLKRTGHHCVLSSILDDLSLEDANYLETKVIAFLKKAGEPLLNILPGGGTRQGIPHTESAKNKNRESHLGPKNPNWGRSMPGHVKQILIKANTGRKPSEAMIQSLRKRNTGRRPPQASIDALIRHNKINPNKGRPHSQESKAKMSRDRLGDKNNRWGIKHTEESLQKMRDAWTKRKQRLSEHKPLATI